MAKHYAIVEGKKVARKSGATHTTYVPTKGENKGQNQYITNGWFIQNNTLVKVTCVTTKKSVLTDKGWLGSVACTLISPFGKSFYWGTMEKKTGKVVIDDLSMSVNPTSPNGGYTGSFINSNKRAYKK